ncbi:glutathione S-transferase family protein [Dongia sp.]|uniref:glutathione S-transferase family protein n=1 Tax=Dongia sp. TaxID=1977262 RepID=UPI003750EA13
MRPTRPITLYGFKLSGHSHRAELMLRLLDLPFTFQPIDLAGGEQRGERFLKLNPFATVPVIDDAGTVVADSVAILVYLASRYDPDRAWLPTDPAAAAEVQRWLSVAQGWLAFGPARARVILKFGGKYDLAAAQALAERLFQILEATLKDRAFLVGDRATLADIALYSYTSVAPEGGIALESYPAIQAWLQRVEALPHFEGMPR